MIKVGSVFKANNYGDLVVTKYVNALNVYVRFVKTGFETKTTKQQIINGKVRDRFLPSVYGVGIIGNEVTKINGKHTMEYDIWGNMLERCYNSDFHERHPTYISCEASDGFKIFKCFKEWCQNQIGFNCFSDESNPFVLDKDILIKGNKLYSEDMCVFIPHEINLLLIKCDSKRGEYPIGVNYLKQRNKYRAGIRINGDRKHLGYYDSPIEAFQAYKVAKEHQIKMLANKWKDQIDFRVYKALCEYKVSIDD